MMGPGARHGASLRRIAVEQVRQEVTQAGFEFAGELHDGENTRSANAHDVHHKTERFLLKFRKP
jgi:predicted methyltransferase